MEASAMLQSLQDPPREYRPVAFWFLNHFLEPDELRRQISEMDEKGFGGVMCHARDGLRTSYLEQGWEDALRIVIDEAERRGMHVWLYDENHYPSGIAGGRISRRFPDRTMMSLVPLLEREIPPGGHVEIELKEAPMYLLAAPTRTAGKPLDLRDSVRQGRLDWRNSLDEPVLLLALVERGYDTNPGNHPDFSHYPDYLDEEVSRAFIEETHEWYARRFGDKFGSTIRGIFTDNACAHFGHVRRCVPWSRDLGRRFTQATGVPIEEVLPHLLHTLPGHREARLRFWRFFGDEFIRTFVGAINDWCKARNLCSTGHDCLEDGMAEHVRQIGSYFDVMRNQNLNAVDQIGIRNPQESLWFTGKGEPLTACIRNTASAALFYGSPRVMCEALGVCGGWNLDLREMRRISGHLAALGVDLFVPHGVYYSIAGTRKYECIPDHLHNPMWRYYREWSDYVARLSFLMADADSLAEVAVLYPVTTLQATIELAASDAGPMRDHGAIAQRIGATCNGLLDALSQRHISYEIISEDILQRVQVTSNGAMLIPARDGRSQCRFRAIILPDVQILEARSLAALAEFVKSGGKVVWVGSEPTEVLDPATGRLSPATLARCSHQATAQAACEHIRSHVPQPITVHGGEGALVSRAWRKDGCRCHFLHNSTDEAVPGVRVVLRDDAEPLRLDLDQPAWSRPAWTRQDGGWQATLDFGPAQSHLFVCGAARERLAPDLPAPAAPTHRLPIDGPWLFSTDRENVLVLRRGRFEQRQSVLRHTFEFEAEVRPESCRLLIDLNLLPTAGMYGRNSLRAGSCSLAILPCGWKAATSGRAPTPRRPEKSWALRRPARRPNPPHAPQGPRPRKGAGGGRRRPQRGEGRRRRDPIRRARFTARRLSNVRDHFRVSIRERRS